MGTVTSVNNVQPVNGNVTISIPDVSNFVTNSSLATTLQDYALISDIPTATSDLTNDSGFITSADLPTVGNGTITITQGGVTKGTFTTNQSGNATIDLDAGGTGGIQNTATGTNSLTILGSDATYNDAINIGYNSNAIGSHSVTIGCESYDAYYPEAGNFSVAIGNGAIAKANSVAIGYEAQCYNNTNNSIAIGYQAFISKNGNNTTTYAIQLGGGTNTTSNTMQVWNYPLLDKTTGLIPDARLSSNIARTSQITTPTYDSTNERITW